MSKFTDYFPTAGGGAGGGGGLTNTYAAFNVQDGSVPNIPTSPGYNPTTGVYEHPEGGVFIQTGFEVPNSIYPNATVNATRHSTAITTNNIGGADVPGSNNSRMHFIAAGNSQAGPYGSIYIIPRTSITSSNILRYDKNADGSYTQIAFTPSISTFPDPLNDHTPRTIKMIVWDPSANLWVGIVGPVYYYNSSWAAQGYTSPGDGNTASATGRTVTTPTLDGGAWTSVGYHNISGGRLDLSDGVYFNGAVYFRIESTYNQGNAFSYLTVTTTGGTSTVTSTANPAIGTASGHSQIEQSAKSYGVNFIRRLNETFTIFSDVAQTTQTATFVGTEPGLDVVAFEIIDGEIIAFCTTTAQGSGYTFRSFSPTAIEMLGDSTPRTFDPTALGLSGTLAHTVFYKIG